MTANNLTTTTTNKENSNMHTNTINNLIAETQTLADKTGDTFVVAEDKATGYVGVTSIDNLFTNSNGNQYDLQIIAKVEPTEAE